MNTKELQKVLELHKKWLNDEDEGECADLSGTNLSGTNLSGANLRSANLSGANLSSANLSSADLRYADLRYANLSDTNLSDANLRDTNLSSAHLRYAHLSRIKIYNTIGDGKVIRSMQLPKYLVNICDDWLQIGCQGHRVHEWAEFTVEEISHMDKGAIEWWNEYRDLVFTFADWKEYVK